MHHSGARRDGSQPSGEPREKLRSTSSHRVSHLGCAGAIAHRGTIDGGAYAGMPSGSQVDRSGDEIAAQVVAREHCSRDRATSQRLSEAARASGGSGVWSQMCSVAG